VRASAQPPRLHRQGEHAAQGTEVPVDGGGGCARLQPGLLIAFEAARRHLGHLDPAEEALQVSDPIFCRGYRCSGGPTWSSTRSCDTPTRGGSGGQPLSPGPVAPP
jgi:hypothetical protein